MATKTRPAFAPHRFAAAAGEPASYDGRQVCAACRKTGRAGDIQHPHDAKPLAHTRMPAVAPEATALDARILGEHDEQP